MVAVLGVQWSRRADSHPRGGPQSHRRPVDREIPSRGRGGWSLICLVDGNVSTIEKGNKWLLENNPPQHPRFLVTPPGPARPGPEGIVAPPRPVARRPAVGAEG